MNEEKYQALCESCDGVLSAPSSTIERIAISWLHVIREHPVFLKNYEELFIPTGKIRGKIIYWLRNLSYKAAWLRRLGKAYCSDGKPWVGPVELPRFVDVLFISHLLNACNADHEADFYFGDMPDKLAALNYSVLIVLINHSGQPASAFLNKWMKSKVPRVVLSGSLGGPKEIDLYRRLRNESLQLKKLARDLKDGLFRKVLVRASQEAFSGSSQNTLRMAVQIDALVTQVKPKCMVVTHEGHAWERIVFAVARNQSSTKRLQCIGYQHAAVFRLQHAIRRNLASKYNPDHIFTAGEVTKAQLESSSGLEKVPITVLGSNRSPKVTIKKNGNFAEQKLEKRIGDFACLVLPEGLTRECNLLFEFSIACAQDFPDIQFIWRLHPVVSIESLEQKNPKLRARPGNILFSKESLEHDTACSRWALYRGTTAIVQAVLAGLRPIYLEMPGEMTIDPLYELSDWRLRVRTSREFENVIRSDINADPNIERPEQHIKKYCERFFMPFNYDSLTRVISKPVFNK